MDIVKKAEQFAIKAHKNDFRKYSGMPYIVHPLQVYKTLQKYTKNKNVLAAALLHDVVEDTKHTIDDIKDHFGEYIAEIVQDLTEDPRHKLPNRAERLKLNLEKVPEMSNHAQTVRLADILDNISDVVDEDISFAKVYLPEKRQILQRLKKGNRKLKKHVQSKLTKEIKRIKLLTN